MATSWPAGPGLGPLWKGLDCFVGLVKGSTDEKRLRTARAVHSIGQNHIHRRQGIISAESNFVQAFRIEWKKSDDVFMYRFCIIFQIPPGLQ